MQLTPFADGCSRRS